ncbi:MAG: hypothetical protein QXU20_02225 [Candidatus Woesearchaeota archaeon]
MSTVDSYFKEFNINKWFELNKGTSASEIKKLGKGRKIIGIEELTDFILNLNEKNNEYAILDKKQMFFPTIYYVEYDFPSDAFITYANTINIPFFTRYERLLQGSPQKLFIDKHKEYTLNAYKKIESSGYSLFDTKYFNEHFSTRGFKYMKSTTTHNIVSENHIIRGWMLFSTLTKLSEKGIYCMEYSTAGGNFYMRIPSTTKTKNIELEEILNGEERKDVLTRNYVTEENKISEWHLFYAKVEDKGEVYRGRKTKYKIPEEFLDHRIIATMILRQFVYKILNKEEGLRKENFNMRDYAEKPRELKKVLYNIIPVPSRKALEIYSKLINRVVIKGRDNPKLSIRELESLFSALNKRAFLENEKIYEQDDPYQRLTFHRDLILEETIKWMLK